MKITLEQLTHIFEKQGDLMEQIRPVELENGYTPPSYPLDLSLRKDQEHLRMMSWYLVEEMTETLLANEEEFAEELSDCLHFAVELCLLLGITPKQVLTPKESGIEASFDNLISLISISVAKLKAKPWKRQFQAPDDEIYALYGTALFLLLGMIEDQGIDPYQIYFHKNEINHNRIQTGY